MSTLWCELIYGKKVHLAVRTSTFFVFVERESRSNDTSGTTQHSTLSLTNTHIHAQSNRDNIYSEPRAKSQNIW